MGKSKIITTSFLIGVFSFGLVVSSERPGLSFSSGRSDETQSSESGELLRVKDLESKIENISNYVNEKNKFDMEEASENLKNFEAEYDKFINLPLFSSIINNSSFQQESQQNIRTPLSKAENCTEKDKKEGQRGCLLEVIPELKVEFLYILEIYRDLKPELEKLTEKTKSLKTENIKAPKYKEELEDIKTLVKTVDDKFKQYIKKPPKSHQNNDKYKNIQEEIKNVKNFLVDIIGGDEQKIKDVQRDLGVPDEDIDGKFGPVTNGKIREKLLKQISKVNDIEKLYTLSILERKPSVTSPRQTPVSPPTQLSVFPEKNVLLILLIVSNIFLVILIFVLVILIGKVVWIMYNNKAMRKSQNLELKEILSALTSALISVFVGKNNPGEFDSKTNEDVIEANTPQYKNEASQLEELLNDKFSILITKVDEMLRTVETTSNAQKNTESGDNNKLNQELLSTLKKEIEELFNNQSKNIQKIQEIIQKENNEKSTYENENQKKLSALEEQLKKEKQSYEDLESKFKGSESSLEKEVDKNKKLKTQLEQIIEKSEEEKKKLKQEIKDLKNRIKPIPPEPESQPNVTSQLVEEYNKKPEFETLEKYGKVVQSLLWVNMVEVRDEGDIAILESQSSSSNKITFSVVHLDTCHLLFPGRLKVSGDGDKDILKGLFECKNYEEHKKKFYIVKPSKVSSQGSQKKWKLVEKGALNFE